MASGAWHYRRAEDLLNTADALDFMDFETEAIYFHARETTVMGAQVHATLALAAATVDAAELHTMEINDASSMTEWGQAVSDR